MVSRDVLGFAVFPRFFGSEPKKLIRMVSKAIWGFFGIIALLLLVSQPVLAVDLHAIPSDLELRSESHSDWDSDISARDNELIDARMRVQLDGSGPEFPDVDAFVRIEGRRFNRDWETVTNLPPKLLFFRVGEEKTVNWYGAFRASSAYSEYRVRAFARAFGENYNESDYAFISRIGSQLQCQDIQISASNRYVNRNDSESFSLEIRNNSEEDFTVEEVLLEEFNDFFSISRKEFDEHIDAGSIGLVEFEINSFSVSSDQTGSVNAKVRGHFENQSCSLGEIPAKAFNVTVRNQGSSSSGSCNEIVLTAFPVFLPKNSITVKTVVVSNNSDRRFFVQPDPLEGTSSAFTASVDSFDNSIGAFSQGAIRIRINSNNVSANQTDSITVKASGNFDGGGTCSQGDVRSSGMPVTVEVEPREASCDALNGEAVEVRLNESEEKELVFRLQNNSGKRFDLQEMELIPDISNFSLQRVSSLPTFIAPYTAAEIRLKARTTDFLEDRTFSVPLRVRGSFDGGLSCGFADTYFSIPFSVSESHSSGGSSSGLCSEIEIESHSVSMDAGKAIVEEFFVKNNADRAFFVDGIEAYDNSSGVIVSPGEFEEVIPAGERGNLNAEIESETSSSDRTATGYLKVRGHFSDSKYCSTTSIGTESFSIHINANESGNGGSGGGSGSGSSGSGYCRDLKVSIPPSVFVFQSAPVLFSVSNPSNRTAFVFLRGAGLTISPNSFSIAPNSNKGYSATVQYFQREPSRLEFVPIGENCEGTVKYANIYNTGPSGSFEPGNGEIKIITAPSQLVFVKRTTVIATIQNSSSVPRIIQVRLEGFSPNWNADKLTVNFLPNETKTVYLDIFSNNNFGSFTGTIVAESGNQKSQSVLKLTAVETIGFGNDMAIQTQVRKNASNAFEIIASIQNNSSQQARGVVSLETLDGAVLDQKNFVSNPNAVQTVLFSLQAQGNQPLPSAVHVRTVLDDGRSAVQRVELVPGFVGGFGFSQGLAGFFSLIGTDSWTPLLSGLLVLLVLLALWLGSRKSKKEPYQAPKRETSQEPIPVATLAAPVPQKAVTTTTMQTATSPVSNGNNDRFWFLKGP